MKYGKTLSDALKFSVSPKRWGPLFILDAIAFSVALMLVLPSLPLLSNLSNPTEFTQISTLLGLGAYLIALFVVWALLRLYISGSLIHQSYKPKEFGRSWRVSKERFLSLLAVSLLVGLISGLLGFIPYVGWLFSIIIGLMFFFALPPVVIDKKSFDDSMRISYRLFRKKFESVLACWIVISLISMVIAFIFVLPLLATLFGLFVPQLVGSQPTQAEVLSMLQNNVIYLVPAAIFFAIGVAITTAFSINAQTNFYLQLKARR